MTMPASGAISMSQINTELGRSSTALISLDTAENGGYAAINTNSLSRPSSSNPASLSEWYSYNHNAISYIPLSFANVYTYNTDSSFPTTYGIYPTSYTTVYFIKNGVFHSTNIYSNNGMNYGMNYYDSFYGVIPQVTELLVGDVINFYFVTGNNYNQGYFTIYFSMFINGSSHTLIGYGANTSANGYAFAGTGFTIPSGTTSIGFTITATAYGAPAGGGWGT